MLRLFMNNELFYSFDASENPNDNYIVTGLRLKKEINSLSSLTISTVPTHLKYLEIKKKRTCFTLVESNSRYDICLFIGKVSSISYNYFAGTVEVTCEDLLGCLRDEVCIYDGDESVTYTYRQALQRVSDALTPNPIYSDGIFGLNTTANIATARINIQADPSSTNIPKLSDKATDNWAGNDYLSILFDIVISYTGATITDSAVVTVNKSSSSITLSISQFYVQYKYDMRDAIRTNTGELDDVYIDQAHKTNVDFSFGNNIINIINEPSQDEIFSAVHPIGSYKVGDTEVNIRLGENTSHSPYILSPNNIVPFIGYVGKQIDFGCVAKFSENMSSDAHTIAEEQLYTEGTNWVAIHVKQYSDKYTITGIDKYYIGTSSFARPIDIGDIVHIDISPYKSYDIYDYCLSLEIDFFNHENDTYVVGPYIPDNILEHNISNIVEYNDKKRKTKNKRKK